MPRVPRRWAPGEPYHLISQFVDRDYRLLDLADRDALTKHIALAQRRWDWRIVCFAYMSTHIHHCTIAGERPPEGFFRSAHTRFAAYHRRRYRSVGPVFASRPKQFRVRRPKLAWLVAYQHRNPVEAGIVAKASESQWTSHQFYLRRMPPPPFLDVSLGLELMGFDDTEAGRREFDEFVMDVDLDDRAVWVADTEVHEHVNDLDPTIDADLWLALMDCVAEEMGLASPLRDRRAKRVLVMSVHELSGASAPEIAARVGWSSQHVSRVIASTPSLWLRSMCDRVVRRLTARSAA